MDHLLIKPKKEKTFFDDLADLSTPENPCDYFVMVAGADGKAGIMSTCSDPKVIKAAFEWAANSVDHTEENNDT